MFLELLLSVPLCMELLSGGQGWAGRAQQGPEWGHAPASPKILLLDTRACRLRKHPSISVHLVAVFSRFSSEPQGRAFSGEVSNAGPEPRLCRAISLVRVLVPGTGPGLKGTGRTSYAGPQLDGAAGPNSAYPLPRGNQQAGEQGWEVETDS